MKKKQWFRVLLALCLLVGLFPALTRSAFAAKVRTLSPWAEAEILRADGYGLLDVGVLARYDHDIAEPMTDWRQPITRAEFARFALSYAAVMHHSDREGFQLAVNALLAEQTPDGTGPELPFSDDGSPEAVAAHALGIVQGRGEGFFDPDARITRQEAATMLCRAYAASAGVSPAAEDAAPFADEGDIDAWALEAVHVLRGRNILLGMGNGRFEPQGNFTVEQCAACFLRLAEQMPVSFLLENVPERFTQEQVISAVGPTERVLRWDGPLAVFLRRDQGAVIGDTACFLVYADGGIRRLEAAVHTHSYAPLFDSAAFSADGKTFTYTMTLSKDDYDHATPAEQEAGKTPLLLSEAGVYTVAVDVPSGAQSVSYQPLETGPDGQADGE
ncbi:MAG: S-layer homology domain-containing protein [Oscillospiraceae bacterium]|nr:S-layer homology domain-containing protein [Oscillospiraceae bacterium]